MEALLWMDEILHAPPNKAWNDDFPVNTNTRYGFNPGFNVVEDFVHPQYVHVLAHTHLGFLPLENRQTGESLIALHRLLLHGGAALLQPY